MGEPYVGEIRMFAGNFPPAGWAFCDGQLMAIAENDVLFNLIGTTYGGDGQTTFALPDLQGRFPTHQGQGNGLSNYAVGQASGSETVTLTTAQVPIHNHSAVANSGAGNADSPAGSYWSGSATTPQFVPGDQTNTSMNSAAIGANGQSQPHDNMQPFLAVSFIISLYGIYPTPN